jgi:4-hydroxy-4-methyl-2-oxoglutarate aldolase
MDRNKRELVRELSQVRLVDVVDGLDYVGVRDAGLMSAEIRPIYEGIKICGPAKTIHYIPTGKTLHYKTPEEYEKFRLEWYESLCPAYAFKNVEEGDVLVAAAEGHEMGLWGSYMDLMAQADGISGAVVDGGCRDRRECKLQGAKVFAGRYGRTELIGRFELESINKTVSCGGVRVRVGDIVFGDDDGVAVVPIEHLKDVVKFAKDVCELDKKNRGIWYRKLNRPLDDTVI